MKILNLVFPIFLATAVTYSTKAHDETIKCGTGYFMQQWSQQQQNGSRALFTPPVLTGTEIIRTTSHFEIHYTLAGADAVSAMDNNSNLIPDVVDTIETAAEYSYNDYYLRGYMLPPRDAIGNDSGKYDIYLINIGFHYGAGLSGLYAFTAPFNDIGDNSGSVETELHSTSSFIVMRSDYSVFTPNINPSVDMEVTISHEFSHAIDFAYSIHVSFWFTEARAAFEESIVYPIHQENFTYLPNIFAEPDAALNLDHADSIQINYPSHFYAGWIFNRYCSEHVKTDFLKPVLALLRSKPSYSYRYDFEKMDESFRMNYETTFREQFVNWLIANYFLSPLPKYEPHTYSRGIDYSNSLPGNGISFEGAGSYSGTPVALSSVTDGNSRLQRLSADYWIISADRNFSIRLNAQGKDTSYNLLVIKQNSTTNNFEMEVCGFSNDTIWTANICDHQKWDDYIVIVARYDGWTTDTFSKQYTITLDEPVQFLNWSYPSFPLQYNNINCVAIDKNNSVWLNSSFNNVLHNGTVVGGVLNFTGYNWYHHHYYNSVRAPGTFSFPGTLADIDVSADNHVWFSDMNSGLYEYNRSTWKQHDNDNTPQTGAPGREMDAHSGTNVWMATLGTGLFELVGNSIVEHTSLPSLNTWCIRFGGGKKYIGTSDKGLLTYNGSVATVYDTTNGLASMNVQDVEVDAMGNVWVALWSGLPVTHGGGIAQITPDSIIPYNIFNTQHGFVSINIHDIAIDDSGTVWAASDDNGLLRLKYGQWISYNKFNSVGLTTDRIYDIALNKQGCLWLGSDKGLYYFCDTVGVLPTPVSEIAVDEVSTLKLFPNPTSNEVTVCMDENVLKENLTVKIFAVDGGLVKSLTHTAKSNIFKMDISNLRNGVYIVETNNCRSKFVKM